MARRGAYPRKPAKDEQAKVDAFLAEWNEKAHKRTAAFEEACERMRTAFPDAVERDYRGSTNVYKRTWTITAANGLTNEIEIER